MYTISINAKTPEEFREAVKGLYALFPGEGNTAATTAAQKEKPVNPVKPADIKPQPATSISVEEVRKTVQEKTTTSEANKVAVKEILSSYGAPSVTKLDPAHYSDFLSKVKALA